MKKLFFIALASSILLFSCQSKEEKANELIKEKLSKTLYDFDSYQPIETSVIEAKANIYNDSSCWKLGLGLTIGTDKFRDYMKDATSAIDHMRIWLPTSYSSSYSISKFNDYKKEAEEKKNKAVLAGYTCSKIVASIKDSVAKIDTTQVIGWEVNHRFRCKTKGGYSTIGNYRYIFDKDFEKILLFEDKDDKDCKTTRDFLKNIHDDFWNNFDKELEDLSKPFNF